MFFYRIGLSGFDNPMRDPKTEELKRHVGQVRNVLLFGFYLGLQNSSDNWTKKKAKINRSQLFKTKRLFLRSIELFERCTGWKLAFGTRNPEK